MTDEYTIDNRMWALEKAQEVLNDQVVYDNQRETRTYWTTEQLLSTADSLIAWINK